MSRTFFWKELFIIKTRIKLPYIYFLIYPNVVFVYKIETLNYLTVAEFMENEGLETFEIADEGEFDSFSHEERRLLEGRGYCINQDDLNNMIRIINIQIQRRISSEKEKEEISSPVHIVTSESAAGSLKVGLPRPKTVIGFQDNFSIGPLWMLDEKIGQVFRNEWLFEHINSEQEDYEYVNKFTNTLLEIKDIPKQNPIYIWTADNSDEQIGFRFILYLLRDQPNEVFLINSSEHYDRYITSKVEEQRISHTSQIHPENIRLLFEHSNSMKPLSHRERSQYEKEWKRLSQTKEVLRLWDHKEIKDAPDYHYDLQIINVIEKLHRQQEKKDFIKTGLLIGEIINLMDDLISVFYLEYRIRHLIYIGVLELKGIPKSMRHYSVQMR
ncbi:DUF1835 domain-containing protein [Metabacillus idriensis]|uniref:DUF1835 domain-containing protein n=1 Tax=Metabacillus idriensis TaxID=324768 RepID=UPI00174B0449|nr:DUF1835 domain-containing protein [Metabacillus idriensis]